MHDMMDSWDSMMAPIANPAFIAGTLAGTNVEPLDDGGICGCNVRMRRRFWGWMGLIFLGLAVLQLIAGHAHLAASALLPAAALLAVALLCPNNRCSGRSANHAFGPSCGFSGSFRDDPDALHDIFPCVSGGSSGGVPLAAPLVGEQPAAAAAPMPAAIPASAITDPAMQQNIATLVQYHRVYNGRDAAVMQAFVTAAFDDYYVSVSADKSFAKADVPTAFRDAWAKGRRTRDLVIVGAHLASQTVGFTYVMEFEGHSAVTIDAIAVFARPGVLKRAAYRPRSAA
jgi:hypothetical protein